MNTTNVLDTTDLELRVQQMYSEVAENPHREFHFETGRALAERLGYPVAELDAVPAAAIDSFAGVGYYLDLAAIAPGETVVDLGSGSGMDSFLAARHAGPAGRILGIDMTDAQLTKATALADASADVVISNGVINLSADKPAVFADAARVLRPGGRLALADIVTAVALPEAITCDAALWAACIGGAMQRDSYLAAIEDAGFEVVTVRDNTTYRFLSDSAAGATGTYGVASISLLARR